MRKLVIAIFAATSLFAVPASVEAAPCEDAKGRFVKCPPPRAAPAPARRAPCRDSKGKFIKCK